ncbi:Transposase family tnp2 [Rhizoctonia solani]|uniref:Transposase family tnp2 n=1 Tax=Rhizoctonia solani TaxID=456999 RepID=A0A8H7I749_9AGAM|nr:Transposase family tnp2 [Rhizoctonia solani]
MVQQMEFRANYVHQEGAMDEVFDGTRYLNLCETPIVVEGKPQGVCYFDKKTGRRDIAYSIMLDGVTIRKKAAKGNSSCWPIMGQNLNLPASKRAKLRNLIPLGALEQARGVRTFDVTTGHHFILRAHPIMVSGNMQAIKHVMEMKGMNARCPCRACLLHGIWLEPAKTYYIPLANPRNNCDIIPDKRIVPKLDPIDTWFDPLGLPLRTHKGIQEQLRLMDAAQTKKEYNRIAMECGLTGHSILDRIPSIQRPDLYLHEFMHLFLLNHGPDLVSLWTGTYKGLGMDAGTGTFILPFLEWCKVGHETEAATKTIAASIIRPFPNIQTHIKCYIAEHWAFWLIYIGPVVLRGRLPKKYYNHYLELVDIMKCLLSINNTTAQIEALREKIAAYVERFKELYYQYNYEQLRVCKSVVHALLHVPNNVLRCGPVWGIGPGCLNAIAKRSLLVQNPRSFHGLDRQLRKAMLFGKSSTPVDVTQMEEIKPGCELSLLPTNYSALTSNRRGTHLAFPSSCEYFLKPNLRWRIAQYFYTNFPVRSFHEWLEFIPERCKRWGKVRIQNAEDTGPGDCIRSAVATNPFSPYGKRDASFVKYTFQRDKNERSRRKEPEMEDVNAYGQLDFILAITLPVNKRFKITKRKLHVLAHITEAEGAEGDAASKMIAFTKFGQSIILDISLVMNLAGRVFTRGVVATGEWIIIDRGKAIQRTAFDIPEEAEEEEVDDVDN